jgi:hypothetical protein
MFGCIPTKSVEPFRVAAHRLSELPAHALMLQISRQLIAMNDQVAVERDGTDAFLRMRLQRTEGHRQMMVVDELFALEIQLRHVVCPHPNRSGIESAIGPPCNAES